MAQSDPIGLAQDRALDALSARYAVVGANRSALNAAIWLKRLGATLAGAKSISEASQLDPRPDAILVSGDTVADLVIEESGPTIIVMWDYEVGRSGMGAFACAVSGVSSVIGTPDGAPGVLPAHVPEQWVGLFGANLALGLQVAAQNDGSHRPKRIDISAADILRSFAEQNSGNHAGVPYGWRRNGRTAIEHGGVFPQGFFRCRDGYVAVQARSRQDWQAILEAFGSPAWAAESEFRNPFTLSEDDSRILPLFDAELMKRGKRELLDLAIASGAPMAPVLTPEEAADWNIFRPGYADESGALRAPYIVRR